MFSRDSSSFCGGKLIEYSWGELELRKGISATWDHRVSACNCLMNCCEYEWRRQLDQGGIWQWCIAWESTMRRLKIDMPNEMKWFSRQVINHRVEWTKVEHIIMFHRMRRKPHEKSLPYELHRTSLEQQQQQQSSNWNKWQKCICRTNRKEQHSVSHKKKSSHFSGKKSFLLIWLVFFFAQSALFTFENCSGNGRRKEKQKKSIEIRSVFRFEIEYYSHKNKVFLSLEAGVESPSRRYEVFRSELSITNKEMS